MMFKIAALTLGLAGTATAQLDAFAGYLPRVDVTDILERDLLQKTLEDLIEDESCTSYADGENYINGAGQDGAFFYTIPTYTASKSAPYEEMTAYYNKENFMELWIKKALQKRNTNFGRGNANFKDAFDPPNTNPSRGGAGDCVGYEEVLKKGISYGAFLIESYQFMQKAIDFAENDGCLFNDGCTNAVTAWDSAAASYIGSLEGTDGNNTIAGSYGKAPYALADKRCRNFRNCGPDNGANYPTSDPKNLVAPVNTRILGLFAAGSQAAFAGDYRLMKGYLRLISNKSAIPLIQGSVRYLWRQSDLNPDGLNVEDKVVGEGGAFIFPVYPKVWACSKRGGNRLYEETKVTQRDSPVEFNIVKRAFECNYNCLGITCEEVGQLFDGDATPRVVGCDDNDNGSRNVCSKPNAATRNACQLYVGNPGITDRNRLKFEF